MVHLEGCGPPLLRWLRSNIQTVGCYAIAVVLVQGLELLLAIQLVRALTVHKGAAGSGGLSIGTPDPVSRPLTSQGDERPEYKDGVWGCRPPLASRGRCQSNLLRCLGTRALNPQATSAY